MNHRTRLGLSLGALLAAAAPVTGQECEQGCGVARSYRTYGVLYHAASFGTESDIMFVFGQMMPRGQDGGWMPRIDLVGGFSLYGQTATGAGLLGGLNVGLARVWTGDYLALAKDLPMELYALVGGSAYAGYHLEEEPDRTAFVPAVSWGFGMRVRGDSVGSKIVTLELLREERFGAWQPRLFLRIGVNSALGRDSATPPAPVRP